MGEDWHPNSIDHPVVQSMHAAYSLILVLFTLNSVLYHRFWIFHFKCIPKHLVFYAIIISQLLQKFHIWIVCCRCIKKQLIFAYWPVCSSLQSVDFFCIFYMHYHIICEQWQFYLLCPNLILFIGWVPQYNNEQKW